MRAAVFANAPFFFSWTRTNIPSLRDGIIYYFFSTKILSLKGQDSIYPWTFDKNKRNLLRYRHLFLFRYEQNICSKMTKFNFRPVGTIY